MHGAGSLAGLYTLEAENNSLCPGGCAYTRDDSLYCFVVQQETIFISPLLTYRG